MQRAPGGGVTVLEQGSVPLDAASPAILRLARRFVDAGWPHVHLHWSRVWVEDEVYVGATDTHGAGDLKTPAHEDVHWWLHAGFPVLGMLARVHWMEGVTPKGARSFKFQEAACRDPVGMPVELFVDYSVSANDLKRVKGEPDEAHRDRVTRAKERAARLDAEYNDGASYLNHNPIFKLAGEFEAWAKEALDMSAKYLERKVTE